ncbi:HK97 family phage prohead protease [Mobiluncus porci]|uniref:HK97 family phage prohead protease n=1 Tax=Mobiluncus porci TaxID=2652278 RepID=A0A7K0K1Z5_9ACTO|nr:HK97 family phage prohead protease [Mobiluncus porci]
MKKNLYSNRLSLRAADSETPGAGRTVEGIAVPWETPTTVGGWIESFERGAAILETPAPLLYLHSEPIGVIETASDEEDGLHIVARISQTARGDEALQLVKDGAVAGMSVGFEPVEWKDREDQTVITLADVREVSLVPVPAYKDAKVTGTRNQDLETPETPDNKGENKVKTEEEIKALREDVDLLTRQLDLVKEGQDDKPAMSPLMQTRSFGAYVEMMAKQEMEGRAWEGLTIGETSTRPAWLGEIVRMMEEKQIITGLFTHTTDLPSEGMTLEYTEINEGTLKVAEQAKEGDDLVYGKVATGTKSASVKTFGGYSSLSKRVIDRSSTAVLDTTFKGLALKYASAIEAETRALVDKQYTDSLATADLYLGKTLATAGILDWQRLMLALVRKYDGILAPLSGLIVSPLVFEKLMELPKTATALQITPAPDERQGTITLAPAQSGSLVGISLTMHPSWDGEKALAYSKAAIEVKESPGAPLKLQDENIVNLTNAWSVYGYAAHYAPMPNALVPLQLAAAGAGA